MKLNIPLIGGLAAFPAFLGPRGPLVLPLVDPYTRTPVHAKNLDAYIHTGIYAS